MTKLYQLTDEHREILKTWANPWIANAMSTKAMDDEDKAAMRVAIKGLYESGGLVPPPEHRIVFVPSPFVARFAGGFAAAIWWLRKNPESNLVSSLSGISATIKATSGEDEKATDAETVYATIEATGTGIRGTNAAKEAETIYATVSANASNEAANRFLTEAATITTAWEAIEAATREAAEAATRAAAEAAARAAAEAVAMAAAMAAAKEATEAVAMAAAMAAAKEATEDVAMAANWVATEEAVTKNDKWYNFPTDLMHKLSNTIGIGKFGLECAKYLCRMYESGNQWPGMCFMLSFFRDVAKLDVDFTNYNFWEKACLHGGPRIMHPAFCIISDRPEVLLVDDQNRPHCSDGPFCKWRDGSALYAWHGARVPQWVIEHPEQITPEDIHKEENAEVRRVMLERYGFERFFKENGGTLVDEKEVWGQPVKLFSKTIMDVTMHYVHVINGTVEPDGTRHEFIINCKNIDNDAQKSVYGTYPQLLDQIRAVYPGQEMKILYQSFRT